MDFVSELSLYFKAGYPFLYVQALEVERAISSIKKACDDFNGDGLSIQLWKNNKGWEGISPQGQWDVIDPTKSLDKIVTHINEGPSGVYVLINFHFYLGKEARADLIQQFMDGYHDWKRTGKKVIILSPFFEIAKELERMVHMVRYSLPTKKELGEYLDFFLESNFSDNEKFVFPESEDERQAIVGAGSGLTVEEFENAIVLSIVKGVEGDEGKVIPSLIMDEKAKILAKSDWVSYFPWPDDMSSVGGLGAFKSWLVKRQKGLSSKAREFGLPYPKGVLLLGTPGTGKSLTVKCMAKEWNLPLIRFDMGAIFQSLVGQSEENMRMSLAQVEALSPVILWIDEMEKGLAGSQGGGGNDSGTTQRVFGTLLSWMQERSKDDLIYVAATVNNINSLPPELLRKGRFDEIFWVDLPPSKERKEILEIHLSKNNQKSDFTREEWESVLDVSKNFSGAELENAVQDAMYEAFYSDESEVKSHHLIKSISSTIPLAQTMGSVIEAQRDWAKSNCRMAQQDDAEKILSTGTQSSRQVII
tara:strand:- start:4158 stop:5750 length:1593 start_codon:yes stop_codon:yes gene_type:complete